MSDDKDITFQDTIEWATSERKDLRSKGIPVFYLVIGSIVVLILLVLIIYLVGRNPDEKMDTLDMMTDDNYIFDEEEGFEQGDPVYDQGDIVYGEGDQVYQGDQDFDQGDEYQGDPVYDQGDPVYDQGDIAYDQGDIAYEQEYQQS